MTYACMNVNLHCCNNITSSTLEITWYIVPMLPAGILLPEYSDSELELIEQGSIVPSVCQPVAYV